ncbi:MAG: WYL domain-containing protein [Chloroflexi bacterium]|nr:WYL domain-containing protein [Chloroflexota bacterium]
MSQQSRRSTRLLEIERLLRTRLQGYTSVELARQLGVSSRSIQRDILDMQSDLNIPILQTAGRYQVMPGSTALTPVRLTLHEARSIFLATRLFLRYSDERDSDAISAMEKIADALPETIARYVRATVIVLKTRPLDRHLMEILRTLTEAWAESRTVHITYRSQRKKGPGEADLDPYLLEPSTTGAATYVIGYSHAHQTVRTFKLDRILRAELTDEVFEAAPDHAGAAEVMELLNRSWGVVFGGDQYKVAVEFSPEVAARVRETHWHPRQSLTDLPGGGVRLELMLPSLLEFTPWVRSWGHMARAVEPPELVAEVAASLRQAAALYDASP